MKAKFTGKLSVDKPQSSAICAAAKISPRSTAMGKSVGVGQSDKNQIWFESNTFLWFRAHVRVGLHVRMPSFRCAMWSFFLSGAWRMSAKPYGFLTAMPLLRLGISCLRRYGDAIFFTPPPIVLNVISS
jgi:hypothetical protein